MQQSQGDGAWRKHHTVFTNAKAGMDKVDHDHVQRVVYEMSKVRFLCASHCDHDTGLGPCVACIWHSVAALSCCHAVSMKLISTLQKICTAGLAALQE